MRTATWGKFCAPTLRNIAVIAPYMHDGSIATLSEVLHHYDSLTDKDILTDPRFSDPRLSNPAKPPPR